MEGDGWVAQLKLTTRGSAAFDRFAVRNLHGQIAIVFDGIVESAPTVELNQTTFSSYGGTETGERHGTITCVARELGVGAESLRHWVRQPEIDWGDSAGTSTADAQRIVQLERENRKLR